MSVPTLSNNRYSIISALGKGGMACVFKVFDSRLKVHKAIKIPNHRCLLHEHIRNRFEVEASTMAQLHHQNIVIVHDIVEERYVEPTSLFQIDLVYMVMEMMPGGSLRDRIEKFGPLHPQQAIDATISMAAGLGFAHSKGVVHRDVKIDNVLIASDNTLKVTDFGIAQIDGGPSETQTGITMGTLPYMAPEQRLSARRANSVSDLYSVAASFFVLLTGQSPSELYLEEVQENAFQHFVPDVRDFFQKGCHYDPNMRFQNAEEMIAALKQLRSNFEKLPPTALPFFMEGMVPTTPSTPSEIQYLWNTLLGINPSVFPSSDFDSQNDTHETALELDLIGDLSDSSENSMPTDIPIAPKVTTPPIPNIPPTESQNRSKLDNAQTPKTVQMRIWMGVIALVFVGGWWFTKDVDNSMERVVADPEKVPDGNQDSVQKMEHTASNKSATPSVPNLPKTEQPQEPTAEPTPTKQQVNSERPTENEVVQHSTQSRQENRPTSNPPKDTKKESSAENPSEHKALSQGGNEVPVDDDSTTANTIIPTKAVPIGTRTIAAIPYAFLKIEGMDNTKLCEGKTENRTWCTLKLPVGTYSVELTTQDGRSKTVPIKITEGQNESYCYQFDINSECMQ